MTKTIDSTARNSNQSWNFTTIRRYESPSEVRSLRVNIKRNAYDEQSFANIEAWSNSKGWVIISSHPVQDFPVASLCYTRKVLTDNEKAKVELTIDSLFAIGECFFGIKRQNKKAEVAE